MARFDDRATKPSRAMTDVLRWQWEKVANRRELAAQPNPPAPSRQSDLELLRSNVASLTWIGHASFALRLGGRLILTDPVFSQRIGGVVRRLLPPGLPLEELPSPDLVLVSHNHWDHLDLPTLKRLGSRPTYVVPLGNGQLLRRLHARVIELDWWQSHREDGLEVTLVPARHWSTRMPWD
ncbi:MAG: MBL fold metallo-hydrolase, partial [Deltaproteobacteria bacterium]